MVIAEEIHFQVGHNMATNATTQPPPLPLQPVAEYYTSDQLIYDDDYMQMPYIRLSFVISYGVVFLIGNVSNVAMLVVCVRQWLESARMVHASSSTAQHHISSAVTNAFVTNLAIADIILCIFSLTSTPYSYYSHEWPFGDFLCRFTPSTLIIAVCVVSFTSTVMAVDRHIAICYPHSQLRLGIRSSLVAIAAVWAFSLAACVPIFLSYRVANEHLEVPGVYVTLQNGTKTQEYVVIAKCDEHWPSDSYRRVFSICVLSIQFLLPAAVIAYCYVGIFVVLRHQKRFRDGSNKLSSSSNAFPKNGSLERCRSGETVMSKQQSQPSVSTNSQRRLLRTTLILMAMILIFMMCWMPINVLLLIADYHSEAQTLWQSTNWFSLAYFCSHLLAMTSTLWNPLLYGWLNERLRPEILKICFPHSNDHDHHHHHEQHLHHHRRDDSQNPLLRKVSSRRNQTQVVADLHHQHSKDEVLTLTNYGTGSEEVEKSPRRRQSSGIEDDHYEDDETGHGHKTTATSRKDSANTTTQEDEVEEFLAVHEIDDETEKINRP